MNYRIQVQICIDTLKELIDKNINPSSMFILIPALFDGFQITGNEIEIVKQQLERYYDNKISDITRDKKAFGMNLDQLKYER